jgi:Protein of unknown function (DUF429)
VKGRGRLREHGCVLGIDVGYSRHRKTTGFCALAWDARAVRWTCHNAGLDELDRRDALRRVLPDREVELSAVAIDGPLLPRLDPTPRHRCAESLLSRGAFARRGKPGATNGGSGRDLHAHATRLAHFVLRECRVGPAAHVPALDAWAIVEAFPNLFLGVLCDEADYPRAARRRRKWTDTLYNWPPGDPVIPRKLRRLVESLAPRRAIEGELCLDDHEAVASFVCALTALSVAANRFVAVGCDRDGWIVLSRRELWGRGSAPSVPWAERELRANLRRVAVDVPHCEPAVYADGDRWRSA